MHKLIQNENSSEKVFHPPGVSIASKMKISKCIMPASYYITMWHLCNCGNTSIEPSNVYAAWTSC